MGIAALARGHTSTTPGIALLSALLLSGCSVQQPSAEFCSDYRDAWNGFASIRGSPDATSQSIFAARDELVMEWSSLANRDDAPEGITDTIPLAERDFTQAWNASSDGERGSYQRSWNNRLGYVALRCERAGHPIELRATEVPHQYPH
jgi:hypothetical protein